jgi:hypothetical protein
MSHGRGKGADALLDEVLERYRDADAALRRCRASPSRNPELEHRAEQTLMEATRLAASLAQETSEDDHPNRHGHDASSSRLWSEILNTRSYARDLQSENVELRRQLGDFESFASADVRYDSQSTAQTTSSLPKYDVPDFIREKELENDRLRAQLHQLRADALAASSARAETRPSHAGMYSLPRRLLRPLSPPPALISSTLHPSPVPRVSRWDSLDRDRHARLTSTPRIAEAHLADEVRRHELESAAHYDHLMADRMLRRATLRAELIDHNDLPMRARAQPSAAAHLVPPLELGSRAARPSEILDAYLARFREDHERFIAAATRAAAGAEPWMPRSTPAAASRSRLHAREGAGHSWLHGAALDSTVLDSASRRARSLADSVRTPTRYGAGLHADFGEHPKRPGLNRTDT